MPTTKYHFDEGGDETPHNGKLHWPGTVEGFPVRGTHAPDLKQFESDDIELHFDFRFKTFKLWEEEDRIAYQDVRDRAANGIYRIDFIHRNVDDHTRPSIYMEWVQIYGASPNANHRPDFASSHPLG